MFALVVVVPVVLVVPHVPTHSYTNGGGGGEQWKQQHADEGMRLMLIS